ncbi:MAG: O-antigen ligase family protein [Anaerolineae bacterium]|nr:O-antigen ligase family protein [Anaerolineae bacterium]
MADLAMVSLVLYTWPTLWRIRKPVSFPLLLPQWLILVAGLIATLVSLDRGGSLKTLAGDLYIYVCFVTLCNAIEDEEIVSKVGKAWVVVACIETFLVLLGYTGIGPRAMKPPEVPWAPGIKREAIGTFDLAVWSGRAIGTLNNANAMASYLGTSFFIFLFLATAFPHKRTLRFGVGIWLLAGIVATGSNAGLAGLAAGVFFMILLRSQHKGAMAWISAAVIITGLVALVFLMTGASLEALEESTGGFAPLRLTLGRLGGGVEKRLRLLTEGWRSYLTAPLGLGPWASRVSEVHKGLHNEYAGHLFERGILALLGLLLMMAEVLFCAGSSASLTKVGSMRRYQLASFVGVCISTAVAALSHEVLHSRDFWFVLALMFAQNKLLKGERGSAE